MRAPRVALLGQPFSKKNLYQDHFCDAKSMPLLVHNEKYFIFIMFRYHINSKSNESDMIFRRKKESDIHYLLVQCRCSKHIWMNAKIGRADASFRRHQIGFSCKSCRIGGLVASCWKIQVPTHASNPLTANSLSLGNAELVSRQGRSYMQIRRCLCIHKILQKPLLENGPSAPVEEALRYRFSNRHP